jgi:hypothetical protein
MSLVYKPFIHLTRERKDNFFIEVLLILVPCFCTAKVVGEEHFGGFLIKRNSENAEEVEKPKSWKEKMEEVIARSKLAKVLICSGIIP